MELQADKQRQKPDIHRYKSRRLHRPQQHFRPPSGEHGTGVGRHRGRFISKYPAITSRGRDFRRNRAGESPDPNQKAIWTTIIASGTASAAPLNLAVCDNIGATLAGKD